MPFQELALQRAFDSLILTPKQKKQSTSRTSSAVSSLASFNTEAEEAICNTKWFLLEENENYGVQEEMAEDVELDAIVDPSNPPQKGWNVHYIRWLLLRYVVQLIAFRLLTVILILIDLGLIIADLILNCPAKSASRTITTIDLIISCYFVFEIALRIFALKPKVFFQKR